MPNSTRVPEMESGESDLSSYDLPTVELNPSPKYSTFKSKLQETEQQAVSFQSTVLKILGEMQLQQQKQETRMNAIATTLEDIKNEINKNQRAHEELEKAVRVIADEHENIHTKIANLEQKINERHAENNDKTTQDIRIITLEDKLEELTRKLRETSIEIKNIPYKSDEQILQTIRRMYLKLSTPFNEKDIIECHRIFSKDNTKRNIILKFNSRTNKNTFLGALKKYNKEHKNDPLSTSSIGFSEHSQPVYASDYLTPKGTKLYYLGRQLKKNFGFKYCWSNLGKIYVKKEDNSAAIHIKNEKQVDEIMETGSRVGARP
nr:uncharacterized protein LOC117986690 [Maniola hyperantus]